MVAYGSAPASSVRWRCSVETPLGTAIIVSTGAGVAALGFDQGGGLVDPRLAALVDGATEWGDPHGLLPRLAAWLKGRSHALDAVPIDLHGTGFQRRVWAQLRAIPTGETRTYGALAAALGKPSSARAVGAAIGRNPAAILVPCHRVLGANGRLTGYAWGLSRKRWLLRHEGALPPERQVQLFGA